MRELRAVVGEVPATACNTCPTPPLHSLLLLLRALDSIASGDWYGGGRRLVVTNAQLGQKLAHLALVLLVLGVLPSGYPFGENRRRGENLDQADDTRGSPEEGCVGGEGAPRVQ